MAAPSRLERNRELIEKSAALLAADYPIGVLMERLAVAISQSFDAMCFVALPNEDATVTITSVASHGTRIAAVNELMPADSVVARVVRHGRAMLMRNSGDWEGETPGFVSAAFVPVRYADQILGVLGVQHGDENYFDKDDVRLLEAVARYLGLAIRHQSPTGMAAIPVRYPWYSVVAIAAIAIASSLAAGLWAHSRAADAFARSNEAQQARLGQVSSALSSELTDGARFARLAAGVVGPVEGDRKLAETLLIRLLGTSPPGIRGIGAFFAPHAFDRETPLYGPYFYRSHGIVRIVNTDPYNYNYPTLSWYLLAQRTGHMTFTDPYTEDRYGFVSVVAPVFERHKLRAVVSVDFLASQLGVVLAKSLAPGDWAYVSDAGGHRILSSGPPISGDMRAVDAPLPPAGWTIHLVTPYAKVTADARQTIAWGLGVILSIWAAALAIFGFLNVAYHARRDAVGLKLQRAQLQSEIATRIDAEERLRVAAYHDALTGLPNRAFFLDQLAEVVDHRSPGEYAVLFIDLDRFYVVNDIMGHTTGDALLRAIAHRFEDVVPPHALIARLGGDEFVVLLPTEGPSIREAIAVAEDVLDALRNPFVINGREVFSNASIGIVRIDDSYRNAETVLRDADISMYHAKRAGRAGYAVFDRTMRDRVTHQLELEGGLRGAVERKEFIAHYQPIIRMSDGSVVGFEALARWDRGGKGEFISANEFIGVAEQTGMLRAIDAELFNQVCRDAKRMLPAHPDLYFSVNISASDLTRASLLADIDATMQRFDLSAKVIKFEITETAVMEDAERALAMLGDLRSRGFEITVDDFGVGYSSLSYLRRLPISGVKIDRSFVAPLPIDGQALEIVRAIVALTRTLGLSVTAEGVERREQSVVLASMAVDFAQGFWYSPAVVFDQAQSFLHETRKASG